MRKGQDMIIKGNHASSVAIWSRDYDGEIPVGTENGLGGPYMAWLTPKAARKVAAALVKAATEAEKGNETC